MSQSTIDGVTGEIEIAKMWQDHYKSILNNVENNSKQEYVTDNINSIEGSRFCFPLLILMSPFIL